MTRACAYRYSGMNNNTTICSAASRKDRIAEARGRLYRVALAWCGDEMLADDLVQETLAVGIIKSQQLRDENRLFAWLYSILNNQWRTHLKRNRSHDDLNEQQESEEAGPCSTCQELEIVSQVRKAVAGLPEIERQVISLVDLEGFSYCDVAGILDIPIGTVMSRLHRARRGLLARLEEKSTGADAAREHLRLV